MKEPPKNFDNVDGRTVSLSTLLVGRRVNCQDCEFAGTPKRVQFPRADADAIYCPGCGRRLSAEQVRERPETRRRT